MTNTKEINILTFADVLEMQRKVVQWNKLFGINPTDKEYIPLYHELSKEEFFGEGEFLESWDKRCDKGILDGLCDMVFTTFQWGVLEGCPLVTSDRDWVEKVDTLAPEIHISVIGSSLPYKKCGAFDIVSELIYLLVQASTQYNVKAAFDRVCESNYSKAVHKDKNVDIEKEIEYITSQGRYGDITCETSGDYIIFKAGKDIRSGVVFDKPKVVKSSFFVDVEELGGLACFKY